LPDKVLPCFEPCPFEDMQAAVSEVLDHLENYRDELQTLMTETFHIIDKQDIPVQYRKAA